jgi:segregation and condensation protein B
MVRRKTAEAEPASFDTELAALPAELRWREWMNRIEAVLFAAQSPVDREALARIVGRDASIELLIDDIREGLRGKPYDVLTIAGGWAFRTRIACHDAIAASAAVPARGMDLSQTEAMVLVSIAYHQPITRAGVSDIVVKRNRPSLCVPKNNLLSSRTQQSPATIAS